MSKVIEDSVIFTVSKVTPFHGLATGKNAHSNKVIRSETRNVQQNYMFPQPYTALGKKHTNVTECMKTNKNTHTHAHTHTHTHTHTHIHTNTHTHTHTNTPYLFQNRPHKHSISHAGKLQVHRYRGVHLPQPCHQSVQPGLAEVQLLPIKHVQAGQEDEIGHEVSQICEECLQHAQLRVGSIIAADEAGGHRGLCCAPRLSHLP